MTDARTDEQTNERNLAIITLVCLDLQTYCSDREPKTHFLSEFSYQAKNHTTIFRMVWDTIVPPGPNAVAYLGGVSTKYLQCVLEYIYLGEVNIAHEDVDKFLEHAKKFKLQGFEDKKDSEKGQETSGLSSPTHSVKEEYVETFENTTEDIYANIINGDNETTENKSLSERNNEENSNELNDTETHEVDQPDLNNEDNFSDVVNDIYRNDLLADDDDLTMEEEGESLDNDDTMLKDTKPVIMNCDLQWEDKTKFVQAKIKKTDKKLEMKNKRFGKNIQKIRLGDTIISIKELDLKLEGLIMREGNVFKCKECHQTQQYNRAILKRHAERHIKQLSVVCGICSHSCPTRSALYAHMKIKH